MYIRRTPQLGSDSLVDRGLSFVAEKRATPETIVERVLDWFRVKWVMAKRRIVAQRKRLARMRYLDAHLPW